MEPETGAFTQLQLSRRSRSKSGIWRAKESNADRSTAELRRDAARDSVMSVADMWASSRRTSVDSSRTSLDRNASSTSVSTRGQEVRRWDGVKRATTHWDEIRRDPELWFPDGDCFIHFYGRGSSRKGPSLRVHRSDLEKADCYHMLSKFADNALLEEEEDEDAGSVDEDDQAQDGGFRSNPNTKGKDELYISAPPLLNREEGTKFHITTRNFFACLYEKPLVGTHLGEALVLVHERFNMYRPDKERNRDDLLAYIDEQRYTDFRDCPDHAMAMMYYAEKLRETDLWTEAFVHCVGMYDILNTAIEFPTVSRTIGALITRAHLEMTLRLEHAYADLGGFMEDSIASAFPKLPEPALKHLERFRSFLHSFYVQQHGYWPPPCLEPGMDYSVVTKSLLRSMYTDLRNLYQFLRDPRSEAKPTQAQIETYQAIYGGICTPALIGAFDRRFKHSPLPNPLPLLPSTTSAGNVSPVSGKPGSLASLDINTSVKPSSGGAFARFLRPSKRKSTKALNTLNMLSAATNTTDSAVMDSLLVQEYTRFERDWTVRAEEKLDPSEGRKVRWLLVYALLQTIIGVIVVPREVSNTENVEYPLCVQTGGTPPWKKRMKTKAIMDGSATPILEALSTATSPAASPYLTPRSTAARSGAVTPISAADAIPPVPQLVLSELSKLAGGSTTSVDSVRTASKSPRPPDSSANSVRSVDTAKPNKSGLKSSSASIRSERSTRSSFSAMMNRSLNFGSIDGQPAGTTPTPSSAPTPTPARKPREQPERPAMQKQKTAPPAVHVPTSNKKLVKTNRTSIFGKSRSRHVSPGRESFSGGDRNSTASPISPARSSFAHARNSSNIEQAESQDSRIPATEKLAQDTMKGLPQRPQVATGGPASSTSPTESEPERGRSKAAVQTTSTAAAPPKKVRNFSRGRSVEGRSPILPSQNEAPPPIPSSTKPRSAATSPDRGEEAAYTDSGVPPQLPNGTKPGTPLASAVFSLQDEDEDGYHFDTASPPPMPVHSKPVSRRQSPERAAREAETLDTDADLPPPLPYHSKPASRSQSPVRAAEAERRIHTNSAAPPPMPLSTKPRSRAQSPDRAAEVDNRTYESPTSPPPIPVASKPPTRRTSPVRPAHDDEIRGTNAQMVDTSANVHPEEHQAVAQPEPVDRRPLSSGRSKALRPAPQQSESTPKVPAVVTLRPGSNISEDTGSAEATHSGSVSPVSEASNSPNTSAEMLQRTTTKTKIPMPPPPAEPMASRGASGSRSYQRTPSQRENQAFAGQPHAVTSSDNTAHTNWEDTRLPEPQAAATASPAQRKAPRFQARDEARVGQKPAPSARGRQQTFLEALREHDERNAPPAAPAASGAAAPRRGSSRESKYRRAAWAELGSGVRNEATGMPLPPPQVRNYGAPILRDAPPARYIPESDSEDEDGGVNGGMASYGVRRGLMG